MNRSFTALCVWEHLSGHDEANAERMEQNVRVKSAILKIQWNDKYIKQIKQIRDKQR